MYACRPHKHSRERRARCAVWARVQVCACGGRISFCGNSADHNCRNPKQLHCIVYGCDLRAMNAFLG